MDNSQLPALQIQIRHHRRTLDVRAIDRVIQNSLFSEAWIFATGKQRREVLDYIEKLDCTKVKDWISKIMIGTLDRCNMVILRQLARQHQVKNYGRLSKEKLVSVLGKKGATNGSRNLDRSCQKSLVKDENDSV